MPYLETNHWSEPDSKSLTRIIGHKSINEVVSELSDSLFKKFEDDIDYFSVSHATKGEEDFPAGLFSCFAIKGGSEGHRVCIYVLEGSESTCHDIASIKTFSGMDVALDMAAHITRLLYQEEEL